MTKQSQFTLALAIFYGVCTASLAASVMVENIDKNNVYKIFSLALLVAIAIVAGITASFTRKGKSPIHINRIAIVGFTIIYLLAFLMADMPIGMAIFPLVMLVTFTILPGYQEWLAKGIAPANS